MKARFMVCVVSALLLVSVVSSAAQASVPRQSPPTITLDRPIVTEEQEAAQHAAFLQRKLLDLQSGVTGPAASPEFGGERVRPDSFGPSDGDVKITKPYYGTASGGIHDDGKTGIYRRIKAVVLKVFSIAFATVQAIIDNIAFAYEVIVDPQKSVTAETLRSYSYYYRDASYFERGKWKWAMTVERRDVYGWAWGMFYDINGVPYSDHSGTKWTYVTSQPSCHFYDDDWLAEVTFGVYKDKWLGGIEHWNACVTSIPTD